MKTRFVLLLSLVALMAAGLPSHAADRDRVERTRREVRSRQDHALIALLRSADDRRRSIEESIARIERKIEQVQRSLDALKPKIEAAKLAREHAATATAAAEGAFQHSRHMLGRNAVSLYATGRMSDVFRLIGTQDLADYVSANVYIDSVIDSNSRLVDDFRESAGRLRTEQQRVEAETKAIIDRSTALNAEQQRLKELADSKERVAAELVDAASAREEAIAAILADPEGLNTVVRSFESAAGAVRLLVAASQVGQPVENPEPGALWQPIEGRLSSDYGWRNHPIYHYRSFHSGIDIAASHGTKIRAARAGEVVDVVYLGAYGLVVIIDHGYSLATMYAHMARAIVEPGEQVQAGQLIGAVGCTGWCTGPHVHWEVWSRGQPNNPLRWL